MTKKQAKKVCGIVGITAAIGIAAGLLIWNFSFRSDEIKIVWKPLAEIASDPELPTKGYDNLDLSETVLNIHDAEKFYQLRVLEDPIYTEDECDAACYELFDIIFGYAKEENPDIGFTDSWGEPLEEGKAYRIYDDLGDGHFSDSSINLAVSEEAFYCCSVSPYGDIIMFDTQTTVVAGVSAGGRGTVEKIIHLNRGEQAPDTTYPVGGEEYSPAQALEFAEKLLSEKLSRYLADAELSPTELVIIKDPDSGNYFYTLQFGYVYEKTPFAHLAMPNMPVDKAIMNASVINLTVSAPDRIGILMIYYHAVEAGDEYSDRYVSLESAIELVNKYLAPYFKQDISEVTINYSYMSPTLEEWDGEEDYAEYIKRRNEQIKEWEENYLRPYWCFIVDTQPSSWGYVISAGTIFVDMQTGEVIAKVSER